MQTLSRVLIEMFYPVNGSLNLCLTATCSIYSIQKETLSDCLEASSPKCSVTFQSSLGEIIQGIPLIHVILRW